MSMIRQFKESEVIECTNDFKKIVKAIADGYDVIAQDKSFMYFTMKDGTLGYRNRVSEMECTQLYIIKGVPFYILKPSKKAGEILCKNIECNECPIKWLCKNNIKAQVMQKSQMCLYNIADLLTKDAPDDLKSYYKELLEKEV